MYAIYTAICLAENIKSDKFLIVSDSLSCLKALDNFDSIDTFTNGVKQKIESIGKTIEFLWIPSHIGICGNEKADSLAKKGIEKQIETSWHTKNDALKIINNNIEEMHEKEWQKVEGKNKLKKVIRTKKRVKKQNIIYREFSRKDARIITRLKIGHTKLTHEFLFTREKVISKCDCGEPLTVKHILENCKIYDVLRNKHKVKFKNLRSNHRKELENVIKFLKEANLYEKV
jgi:hypothetical protein